MDLYVINWRETTITPEGTMDFDSGTCETAFKTKEEAKNYLEDCLETEYKSHEDRGDSVSKTLDDDYGCVNVGEDTYEYWVYGIYYEDIDKTNYI